jgi:hypothetical protein
VASTQTIREDLVAPSDARLHALRDGMAVLAAASRRSRACNLHSTRLVRPSLSRRKSDGASCRSVTALALLRGKLYAPRARIHGQTLLRRTFHHNLRVCQRCRQWMMVRASVTGMPRRSQLHLPACNEAVTCRCRESIGFSSPARYRGRVIRHAVTKRWFSARFPKLLFQRQ